VLLLAQPAASFEAASVKQNVDAGSAQTWTVTPDGEVRITNYLLFQLIAIAYDSPSIQTRDQITGGPAWLRADHFDIVAKGSGNLGNDETGRPTRLLAMLRSLLEDHFTLRMHSERREAPVYMLMPANRDRRPGPRLRPFGSEDCASRDCGWRSFGNGHLTIQGVTMADLARGLASLWSVGRPVIDRTGLPGRWNAEVDYVPSFVPGPNTDSAPVANPSADSGPDLPSAIRDQLGLKLQRGKAAIEYLVIDSAAKPRE
jgi:uncharacterized protein (TIGR03435 family)